MTRKKTMNERKERREGRRMKRQEENGRWEKKDKKLYVGKGRKEGNKKEEMIWRREKKEERK